MKKVRNFSSALPIIRIEDYAMVGGVQFYTGPSIAVPALPASPEGSVMVLGTNHFVSQTFRLLPEPLRQSRAIDAYLSALTARQAADQRPLLEVLGPPLRLAGVLGEIGLTPAIAFLKSLWDCAAPMDATTLLDTQAQYVLWAKQPAMFAVNDTDTFPGTGLPPRIPADKIPPAFRDLLSRAGCDPDQVRYRYGTSYIDDAVPMLLRETVAAYPHLVTPEVVTELMLMGGGKHRWKSVQALATARPDLFFTTLPGSLDAASADEIMHEEAAVRHRIETLALGEPVETYARYISHADVRLCIVDRYETVTGCTDR